MKNEAVFRGDPKRWESKFLDIEILRGKFRRHRIFTQCQGLSPNVGNFPSTIRYSRVILTIKLRGSSVKVNPIRLYRRLPVLDTDTPSWGRTDDHLLPLTKLRD